MEPLLVLIAEWWWIAPAGAGAGAIGWAGARLGRRRITGAKRIAAPARRVELDAARIDVRNAADAVTRTRAQVKLARAELLQVQAEKSASRAPSGAVPDARRRLQQAERDARAAVAELRARRAAVPAARAMMPRHDAAPDQAPLARLVAQHDELTARWVAYETDPALALGYPSMSDARWPPIELFLRELQQASWLRPASRDARMAPADFSAYREAVRRATHAFDSAERAARRGDADGRRRAEPPADWSEIAHELLDNAQRTIARSTEVWNRARERKDRKQNRDDA